MLMACCITQMILQPTITLSMYETVAGQAVASSIVIEKDLKFSEIYMT